MYVSLQYLCQQLHWIVLKYLCWVMAHDTWSCADLQKWFTFYWKISFINVDVTPKVGNFHRKVEVQVWVQVEYLQNHQHSNLSKICWFIKPPKLKSESMLLIQETLKLKLNSTLSFLNDPKVKIKVKCWFFWIGQSSFKSSKLRFSKCHEAIWACICWEFSYLLVLFWYWLSPLQISLFLLTQWWMWALRKTAASFHKAGVCGACMKRDSRRRKEVIGAMVNVHTTQAANH